MKLCSIDLINFQGLRKFSYTQPADAGDIVVIGENEAGKTTIANALTWLLTNKPYTGEKNYSPKTITESGDMHGAEHLVQAVYVEDDGDRLDLAKIYKEIWTKKRGNTEAEFTGHTSEYFVDGVPVSEKDYNAKVADAFGDAATIMQLTVPTHFAEVMSWQDRRALIMAMSGADVTDTDVIASKPELKDLALLLSKGGSKAYTVDELLAIKSREKTKINDEIKSVPARIDEHARLLDELLPTAKIKEIQDQIETLEGHLDRERNSLDAAENATQDQAQRVRIAELNAELAEAHAKHRETTADQTRGIDEEISKITTEITNARATIKELDRKRRDHGQYIRDLKRGETEIRAKRETIKVTYAKIFAEEWQGQMSCPTCKRDYEPDQIASAQAHFNQDKSRRLKAIVDSSQEFGDDVLQAKIDALAAAEKDLELLEADIEDAQCDLTKKDTELSVLRAKKAEASPDFGATEEYRRIRAELDEVTNSSEKSNTQQVSRINELKASIIGVISRIDSLKAQLDHQKVLEKSKQRIIELEEREKELAAAFEDAERAIWLCEEFKRAQAALLEDTVNGQFKTLKVKLFEDQINGGLKDTCEVMIPSDAGALIPYKAANNAGRINAGLEIIERLAAHYGRALPVIIDNAESVNHIYTSEKLQLIRLEVAPAGTPLTVMAASERSK